MDATELLKKDHDKVRELFAQFRGGGGITGLVKRVTGNVSERERRSAVEKVCNELDVHALIEEEIFYPAVKGLGDPELARQVDEGIREHGTVKQDVARIRQVGADGEPAKIDELMTKLEECVEHHASEEEREMFPRVRDLMADDRRMELGRQLQARKRSGAGMASRARAAAGRRSAGAARTRTGKAGSAGRKTMTASAKRRKMKAAKATGRGMAGRRTTGKMVGKTAKGPKRARGGRRR